LDVDVRAAEGERIDARERFQAMAKRQVPGKAVLTLS
jgi:hypothetical protein